MSENNNNKFKSQNTLKIFFIKLISISIVTVPLESLRPLLEIEIFKG